MEWVDDSGETVEEIEVAAIEALGYTSIWANYGVKLVAGEHVIIATPWPREIRVRESSHTLYNLSGSGSASGQRPDVFPRSPGYVPGTTYTGPVSSL
ncbi:hypothetical protein [Pseudoxanthomonas mexicana]|uniref:hypothetical protein n=1 Tax=Pseudoxanthomonas mexicana TaxID=128785 RepID=UPI0028AAD1F6|nr:hypothetical protein [Pseudoxanthomonas mexicana]